jgi:hypothetical protein
MIGIFGGSNGNEGLGLFSICLDWAYVGSGGGSLGALFTPFSKCFDCLPDCDHWIDLFLSSLPLNRYSIIAVFRCHALHYYLVQYVRNERLERSKLPFLRSSLILPQRNSI